MGMEIKIFPNGFSKKIAKINHDEIPVVMDYSVKERMKTLYSNGQLMPISRAIIGGKVTHTITAFEIARKFGEYFRSGDKESLFNRNDCSNIFKELFGKDSFETCNPLTNMSLNIIFTNYLQSKDEKILIPLWHSFLAEAIASWHPGTNLTLTEVIPLLTCKIGMEGILEFKKNNINIERLSKAITSLTQPKQNQDSHKNINKTACDGWNAWIVTSCIRKELAAALEEFEKNPNKQKNHLFFNMAYYFQAKNSNQIEPTAINNTLESLTHNYLYLLFAFQITISPIIIHLLWELSKNPSMQEKYREIAYKAELLLNSTPEIHEKCYSTYYEQLKPFNTLIAEGLRLYSPVGFKRQLQYDALLTYGIDEKYHLHKGEIVEYWPYTAGQDPEVFNNPTQFDEERFSSATQGRDAEKKYNAYHFGPGCQQCPVTRHAYQEIKVILAYLLRHFSFSTTQQTIELHAQYTLNSAEPIVVKTEKIK